MGRIPIGRGHGVEHIARGQHVASDREPFMSLMPGPINTVRSCPRRSDTGKINQVKLAVRPFSIGVH